MKKRLKVLRAVHIACLSFSVLLALWWALMLLVGAKPAIEWTIWLFIEIVGILESAYALRDLRKAEEKQSKELQSDNVTMAEKESDN